MSDKRLYGMVAEFGGPSELIEAAREARERGYRAIEAYTPYPLEELDEILGGWNPVPLIVLLGGLSGAATAWAMEYYIAAIDYPINVGGRPLNSWPAFIPILFELTVLFASIAAFLGTLILCGFPRPHHALFDIFRFRAASRDAFFLCVESTDLIFEPEKTSEFLESLEPLEVWEVENS
jgi:hypothetical protein